MRRCPSRTLKAGYPRSGWLDCFRNSCHRPLACPSVFSKAAAAGIEPAKGRLTGACLYQTQAPPQCESGWSDLNRRVSCARSRRTTRLSHTLKLKRPAGVEPALPPWQGSRLPLHHGRIESLVELSKIRAPGGTRTHVAALRVRSPRRWTTSALSIQWDQRDLNPHRPG